MATYLNGNLLDTFKKATVKATSITVPVAKPVQPRVYNTFLKKAATTSTIKPTSPAVSSVKTGSSFLSRALAAGLSKAKKAGKKLSNFTESTRNTVTNSMTAQNSTPIPSSVSVENFSLPDTTVNTEATTENILTSEVPEKKSSIVKIILPLALVIGGYLYFKKK
jgi:hypothetical protein